MYKLGLLCPWLAVVISLAITLSQPVQTLASTSNTINFQARLENISGAIVPDGNYNVEFRLYTAASGGTLLWTEDYLNSASQGISVADGYLTANLGSITAFPSTINWDQQLWLTMNIGGTTTSYIGPYSLGNSAWDGEMSPRLPLTAVPYAFRSGQAGGLFDPGGSGSVLNWNSPSSNYTLTLPNESGTLCTNATGGTCSSLYIQNQTASPQSSAGFNISGSGTFGGNLTFSGSSGATIQGPSSGLTVNNTSGSLTLSTTTSGTLALTSAGDITEAPSSTGAVLIGNSAGSGSITLGSSSSSQSVYIANGAGAATVNIANVSTAGNLVNIAGDNSATADTINIGTGSTSVAGGKTINIGNGTPTGSGTNVISIGASTNGSTVTLQGGATEEQLTNSGDKISISNASSAFQVSNGTNNVFSVSTNTTTPQAVLGTNTNLAGSLLFNTTSSGNPITLQATTDSTSGGYTLSLPTSAPAGGLCLQTSSTYTASTGQLVFGQCSNSNASVSLVSYNDAHGSTSSTVSSVTNTTSNIGDLIVVTAQIPSGTAITGISGGNVSTWSRVGFLAGDGTVNRVEMWMGTVTSVGSSTISLSPSGSLGNADEITETEYTASGVNTGTTWGVDTEATNKSTGSSTVTFPTLTPQSQGELYEGYAQVQHTPATAGSSSGFSYQITGQTNVIAYNTNVNPIAAFTPTANQNSSGEANTVAAIFTPFVSSTAINNSIVPQLANFNVQAPTSGAPAAVLQATVGDTADNLLNFYGDTTGQTSANEVLSITEPGNIQFGGLSNQIISVGTQTSANTAGANLSISAAAGNGSGVGGTLTLAGGNAGATTGVNGGAVLIEGGAGASTGTSGSVIVQSNATNSSTAFVVQNASGSNILTTDTVNSAIDINTSTQYNGYSGAGTTGTWQTGTTLSGSSCPAVIGSSAVAYGGYIYEIGGTTNGVGSGAVNNICSASLNASTGAMGSWVAQTNLPQALAYATAVEANGYVYVMGGTNSSDQSTVYYASLSGGTVGTWNSYTSGSSSLASVYPSGLEQASSAVYNNYIYLVAGDSNGTRESATYYASVNPSTGAVGTWTSTSALGTAVSGNSVVAYAGYLYEMGGSSNSNTCSGNNVTTVYYAQINSNGTINSWTSTTVLPDGRYQAASVAWDGYIYNIGGTTTGGTCAAASIVTQNGVLSAGGGVSSWPDNDTYPYQGWGDAVAVYNGYVYELGGTTNGTTPLSSTNPNVEYATVSGTPTSPYNFAVVGNSFFQPTTDSTSAFVIQNAEGNDSLFTADTLDDTIDLASNSTTASLLSVTDNSATSGTVVSVIGNALTSGALLSVSSSSTGSISNGLVQLIDTGAYTGGSGGLLNLNAGTKTGVAEYIQDNSITTGTELSLNSTTTLTSGSLIGVTLTSTGNLSSGVVAIQDTHAYTGTGGLLNLSSGTQSGNVETLLGNSVTSGIGLSVAANVLTSGSGINVTSTASTSLTTGGLVVLAANSVTTTSSTGGLLQVQGNALTTGYAADFSSSSSSLSTGGLLQITDNSATTATGGLLQINGTSLSTGVALNINAGTGIALSVDNGGIVNLGSSGSSAAILEIPTATTCSSGTTQGLTFESSSGTRLAHLCSTGSGEATLYANTSNAGTDVAENYSDVNDDLNPGDVVALANDGIPDGIVAADESNQNNILGVISTAPGVTLSGIDENGNTDLINPKPVALAGRIPTNVTSENGPIEPGDYLTLSTTTPGYAMKATQPGYVIGQALTSYTGSGTGQVIMFVKNMYYAGPSASEILQSGTLANLAADNSASINDLQITGLAIVSNLLTEDATTTTLNVTGLLTTQNLIVVNSLTTQTLQVLGNAEVGSLQVDNQLNLGSNNEDPTLQTPHPITVNFRASSPILAGSVVVVDPSAGPGYVATTTQLGDTRVVGVAVTNATTGELVQVAIGGTAKVLVSGGAPSIGELLVSSNSFDGATPDNNPIPSQIIGKVLGTVDQNSEALIIVTPQ